jgi:hypothetical protein
MSAPERATGRRNRNRAPGAQRRRREAQNPGRGLPRPGPRLRISAQAAAQDSPRDRVRAMPFKSSGAFGQAEGNCSTGFSLRAGASAGRRRCLRFSGRAKTADAARGAIDRRRRPFISAVPIARPGRGHGDAAASVRHSGCGSAGTRPAGSPERRQHDRAAGDRVRRAVHRLAPIARPARRLPQLGQVVGAAIAATPAGIGRGSPA